MLIINDKCEIYWDLFDTHLVYAFTIKSKGTFAFQEIISTDALRVANNPFTAYNFMEIEIVETSTLNWTANLFLMQSNRHFRHSLVLRTGGGLYSGDRSKPLHTRIPAVASETTPRQVQINQSERANLQRPHIRSGFHPYCPVQLKSILLHDLAIVSHQYCKRKFSFLSISAFAKQTNNNCCVQER